MKISVEQTPKQKLSQNVLSNVDSVSVTHLPGTRLSETVTAISNLRRQNSRIKIIPHIAARNLKNKKELYDNCDRFVDLGVKDVLIIGGSRKYGNCYGNAFDLLKDLKDKEYGFNFLCGVYPQHETHDSVTETKYTKFARGITQICLNLSLLKQFDQKTIVGVPSNCTAKELLKFIKLCGIARTTREIIPNVVGVKYLSCSGFNTAKFVKKLDNQFDIHVFNFGNLDKTVNSLIKLL